jgi:hypothetical protein
VLILNRVVKDWIAHAELDREIQAAARRGRDKGVHLPSLIYAEFVDSEQGEGGSEGVSYFITVPYAYAKPRKWRTLAWFVGHELAHVWQASQGGRGILPHDAGFYAAFLALCDPLAQPLEHGYRPQAAKRHGVPRRLRSR